jgi:predicted nucleic acid-binding protein
VIFVDTSFWVAYRNRSDAHHGEAVRLLQDHATVPLIATNHVRGETWTYLRRKAGHAAACHFLDQMEASRRLDLVRVSD